jgi:hypothetical protein
VTTLALSSSGSRSSVAVTPELPNAAIASKLFERSPHER